MSLEAKIPNIITLPSAEPAAAVQSLSATELQHLYSPLTESLPDSEDLCPAEQLVCQLQTTPEDNYTLSITLSQGAKLNITDLCLDLLGPQHAPGPCENQIVGILGDRTRNFSQPFTIQLEQQNNQLGFRINDSNFINLNQLIQELQANTQKPDPIYQQMQLMANQYQAPTSQTTPFPWPTATPTPNPEQAAAMLSISTETPTSAQKAANFQTLWPYIAALLAITAVAIRTKLPKKISTTVTQAKETVNQAIESTRQTTTSEPLPEPTEQEQKAEMLEIYHQVRREKQKPPQSTPDTKPSAPKSQVIAIPKELRHHPFFDPNRDTPLQAIIDLLARHGAI